MLSRRNFIQYAASTGLLLNGCSRLSAKSSAAPQVVIIGGGFGGATVAKYIRKLDPNIQVTLIEPNTRYVTCPGSNWVLGGIKPLAKLTLDYKNLIKHYDIRIINDAAINIAPERHLITLKSGGNIRYDRLVVSPGIAFRWDSIAGYDENTAQLIPHAWKAGKQTEILAKQLSAMKNGGTVIICAPPNPYRCPPGSYERASMIAFYLQQHKPKSKVLILDPKSIFSKQALFTAGWSKYFGYGSDNSMIEWLSIPDNPIIKMDAKQKRVETDFGDIFKADVLNYIPAQKAGMIAHRAGLTDAGGWCPIRPSTSESSLHPDIHASSRSQLYLVSQVESGDRFCMKTPSVNYDDDPAYIERFVMESWIGSRIQNPHVAKVIEPNKRKTFLYYLTEYIDGITLQQWIKENPKPDVKEVIYIVEQVVKGMRAFHRRETLHQDIKPGNIMLDRNGEVKIVDFGSCFVKGIAEIDSPIERDVILGTAGYSAPEVVLGDRSTVSSDIFSLAVIIFEMLTGKEPFDGKLNHCRTAKAYLKTKYIPAYELNPLVPVWMDCAIKKGLRFEPERRYAEVDEFLYELKHPNPKYKKYYHAAVVDRNPVLFWQVISGVLFFLLCLSLTIQSK